MTPQLSRHLMQASMLAAFAINVLAAGKDLYMGNLQSAAWRTLPAVVVAIMFWVVGRVEQYCEAKIGKAVAEQDLARHVLAQMERQTHAYQQARMPSNSARLN